MSQSRSLSAIEAAANVMVGWLVALATQVAAFSDAGLRVSVAQHLLISVVFLAVSFLRSYALRRLFAKLG